MRAVFALLLLLITANAGYSQTGPGEFTVIALPDTQNYSEYHPHIFAAQTKWIADNKTALNIKFVVGLGDVVNNGWYDWQLQNADAAIRTLEQAGIPFILPMGNHDYVGGNPRDRVATKFNNYFGPARFAGKTWYKGNFPEGSNENYYTVFDIYGTSYLIMALEFAPRDAVIQWANSIIMANPDKKVIIALHDYLHPNGMRGDQCDSNSAWNFGMSYDNEGEELWRKVVRRHKNVMLVMNGHTPIAARRADLGEHGNLVNQLLADYQSLPNGGDGWLRILTFRPALNRIDVQTYSTFHKAYRTGAADAFSIPMVHPGSNTGKGAVKGRVRSWGCTALAGAKVSWSGGQTYTGTDGGYLLTLPPGTHPITVQASGFAAMTRTVRVDDGFTAQANFYPNNPSYGDGDIPPLPQVSAPPILVTITSPTDGFSNAGPAVNLQGLATSTEEISTFAIYLNNVKVKEIRGVSSLQTWLSVPMGWNKISVNAWNAKGAVDSKSIRVYRAY